MITYKHCQLHFKTLKTIGFAAIIAILLYSANACAQTVPNFSQGIYYKSSATAQPVEIEASIMTNSKNGGFGEVMKRSVTGLINAKMKATLSGAEADVKVHSARPVFIFMLDTTQGSFNASLNPKTPKEFLLVRMTQNKKTREIITGKYNSISSNIGIDDKIQVAFTSTKIRNGVYQVTVSEPLEEGEYCFMLSSASAYQAAGTRVYDFSRQ